MDLQALTWSINVKFFLFLLFRVFPLTMAGTTPSDGEDGAHNQRPKSKSRPTAAPLEHSEAPALPSQQKHINEFCAAKAARSGATRTPTQAINQVQSRSSGTTPSAGASI